MWPSSGSSHGLKVPKLIRVGSMFLMLGVTVAVAIAVAGWAILNTGSKDDEALERDEANISAGRKPGPIRPL
jgi:hypothetical protein